MGTNYAALESVGQHIERSAQYVARWQTDHAMRWLANSAFESPLEAIFYVWWTALERAGQIGSSVTWVTQEEVEACGRKYRVDFKLLPEHTLQYRAEKAGVPIPKVAVELDGHDFHERTKEQVAYRNQRDRDLVAAGWTVLHFSGSELYRDPEQCIQAVFNHALRAFSWDWEMQVNAAEIAAGS